MNLGALRAIIKDLPDDTEVLIWDGNEVTWFDVSDSEIIPATPIHPRPAFVLDTGECVELEFDLAVRTGVDER